MRVLRDIAPRAAAAVAMILLSVAAAILLRPCGDASHHDAEESVCRISPYDEIMRAAAAVTGIDWRLLCAIACVESEFDPAAVSGAGAVGLMQIMPSVGEHYGVCGDALLEPSNNISVAASLLCDIERMMSLPATVPEEDRLRLVLACYNSGIGHVNDARRLAKAYGEDMNSWPVVARYLRLKNEPEYYGHESVASGSFSGGRRTAAYVRDVMNLYAGYVRRTSDAAQEQ